MDFNDQPSQPRVILWKPILIIGSGVVIAIGLILGIIAFTHRTGKVTDLAYRQAGATETVKTEKVLTKSIDQCDGVPNPDGCKAYFTKKDAATKKDVKSCDALSSAAKDDCVWGVAVAANDSSLCKKLSNDDDARLCANRILTSTAVAASDDSMCDKITDTGGKKSCVMAVRATVTAENCEARKQDPAYCTFLKTVESAIKASDRDVCNVLIDSFDKERCRIRVPFDDPDHDGLSTEQELNVYHTDPRKADTDGDGYSDGDEVKTGHDPLKK